MVLAASGVAVWLLAAATIRVARRPRRPDPAPATMELRPEPPAVAGMLVADFEVTRDALPATLLDLAARGALEVEQYGDETFVALRDTAADLLDHERRVLEHVRRLAGGERGERVPAAALTTGPADSSRRWWARFRKEVVGEAQRRGLSRPVWDPAVVGPLWVVLLAIGGVLWASVRFDFETVEVTPLYVATLVAVAVAFAVAVAVLASDRQRDTSLGRQAAAHWLGFSDHHEANEVIPTLPPAAVAVRGRYLAYCAALGHATASVRALPLGAESDRRAWTNYGGRWRHVRVRYPRLRPGWGRRPGLALLAGAVGAFVAVNVVRAGLALRGVEGGGLEDYEGWFDRAGAVVAAIGALALVWFATQLLLALADLVLPDQRITGRVVRSREKAGFEFNPQRERGRRQRYVAVDTGTGERVVAWSVNAETYARCPQGRAVVAVVTPVLRHVRSVEPAQTVS